MSQIGEIGCHATYENNYSNSLEEHVSYIQAAPGENNHLNRNLRVRITIGLYIQADPLGLPGSIFLSL